MVFRAADEMFAFVAVDPSNGSEGIIGALMPSGQWMPFVGADMTRVDDLKPLAKALAITQGRTVRLVKFSTRTEIESY